MVTTSQYTLPAAWVRHSLKTWITFSLIKSLNKNGPCRSEFQKQHREQYKKEYLWPQNRWLCSLERLCISVSQAVALLHSHWCCSQISRYRVILARMDTHSSSFIVLLASISCWRNLNSLWKGLYSWVGMRHPKAKCQGPGRRGTSWKVSGC